MRRRGAYIISSKLISVASFAFALLLLAKTLAAKTVFLFGNASLIRSSSVCVVEWIAIGDFFGTTSSLYSAAMVAHKGRAIFMAISRITSS